MRNNETGEFELVVGNRQLLSGFFIVVLLFAVAFAMGYVVGQNAPRSAKIQAEAAPVPAAATPDGRPQPASPVVPAANPVPPPDGTTPAAIENAAPPPATQPAKETPTAPPPAPAAATAGPADAGPGEPPPGSYWQVRALPLADAELAVRALKEKGLPALTAPGTNNLFRVLVGPYTDAASLGKAKTELEAAGFRGIFLRK
jgi:cell division septation protein DedD